MTAKTNKKSCSLLKVAITMLGYALLTAFAAGGRRKPRRLRDKEAAQYE